MLRRSASRLLGSVSWLQRMHRSGMASPVVGGDQLDPAGGRVAGDVVGGGSAGCDRFDGAGGSGDAEPGEVIGPTVDLEDQPVWAQKSMAEQITGLSWSRCRTRSMVRSRS